MDLGVGDSVAQMRTITVMFVNLDFIYLKGVQNLMQLQNAVASMQRDLYQYEGTVRQFLVDDKGSVMIGVFGTPPNAHEDDCSRAVMSASLLQRYHPQHEYPEQSILTFYRNLKSLGIETKIGITTGTAFTGDVGNQQRREYAVVGDIVVRIFFFFVVTNNTCDF